MLLSARLRTRHRGEERDPGAQRPFRHPLLGEAVLVWAIYGLQTTATLVTYSRLQPQVLYNVDEAGDFAGGLGRTLVLLNYPIALAAIGLAALTGGPRFLVWTAIVLCTVTALPGVVDQGDLDARWINVVPALGVALALGLTVAAVRRDGAGFAHRPRGDRLRLVLGAVLLFLLLPWAAAETGFYLPGDFFMGEEIPPVRDEGIAAVHLGFHHGTGGVLLALTALILSRAPGSRALAAYLSVMLAYGLANAFQDAWNEQLWKRGTVDTHVPSVIRPELSLGWLAIVLGAATVYARWFRPARER